MKTLVIGTSGQVGGWLRASSLKRGHACVGTGNGNASSGLIRLDIRDAEAVEDLIAAQRFDAVFLPAAMTHVDHAETHPDECRAINVDGTVNVARAVQRHGGTLIFFSTEHVFAESPHFYLEDAPCDPASVYAKSKVEAEERVRDLLPDRHLILRTSWVFGPESQKKNFVYRAVATLRQGKPLVVPSDQYGQPTYAPDLADAALDLLAQRKTGTFHVVGPAHLHRLDFARLVCQVFALDRRGIEGVPSATLGQPAPRPRFIGLCRDKLIAALGCDPIRHPQQGLQALRKEMEA
ncbi:MAG: NAD(P)-dependent oxidoreductase [Planctomycetes bacterium]|nr:NAD(P)-dependent oxidoreductase [Planctomycetota bacterium]